MLKLSHHPLILYRQIVLYSNLRKLSSKMEEVKSKKKLLRTEMKKVIAGIPGEVKDAQSRSVFGKLIEDPIFQGSKSISIYLHMEDEIRTLDILQHALSLGKSCYIPRYFVGGLDDRMEMVRLQDMNDFQSLPITKWKIKQPADDDVREEALSNGLDMVLVPGLAFTRSGKRLGRGKGYYDTYLHKARSLGLRPTTVALCFNEQILEDIPTNESDFIIDRILSDK